MIEDSQTSSRPSPTYGLCLACRSVEVELDRAIGTPWMGASDRHPTGYGCELCS